MEARLKPLSAAEEALLVVMKYTTAPQCILNDESLDGLEIPTESRSSVEEIAASTMRTESTTETTDMTRKGDESPTDKEVIDLVEAISAEVNAICNEEVIESEVKKKSNIEGETVNNLEESKIINDESITDEGVLSLLTKISAEVDTVCNERVIGIGPSEIKKSMKRPKKMEKPVPNTETVAIKMPEHLMKTDEMMEHFSEKMDTNEKSQRQNLEEGLISIASERKKRARQRGNCKQIFKNLGYYIFMMCFK